MQRFLDSTVIVPWDFSAESVNALQTTLEMVDANQIHVLHVATYPTATEPGVIWGTITEDTIIEHLDKAFRESATKNQFPELKFSTLFGDPGSRIAETARDEQASLIVISSHGRTGLGRLLLGSVAERVVRLAPCPVLVLRKDLDIV